MRFLTDHIFFPICVALAFCGISHAADMDPALAPFVTAGTLLVAKADLTRFDAAAADAALIDAAQSALGAVNCRPLIAKFDPRLPEAQRWLSDFRGAGGGTVYAAAFLGDPTSLPGVLIVPLSPGSDAKVISALLVSGRPDGPDHRDDLGPLDDNQHPVGLEAIVINNAVVFGATPQVEKMKAAIPVDRPMLADALASLGNVPFEIVFSPSIALDLVAADLLPEKLPDEFGGGSPSALVDSLAWAALGGTAPPGPTIRLLIQCKDADGAQGYTDLLNATLASLPGDPTQKPLPEVLKPTTQDDRLSLTIDAPTMTGLVLPRLLTAVGAERPGRPANADAQPSTLP
jgi:hypothetical protein